MTYGYGYVNNHNNNDDDGRCQNNKKMSTAGIIFVIVLWILLGLIPFIWSLLCFGKAGGSTGQNTVGLLVAIFLGPFWYIYYLAAKQNGYCTNPNFEIFRVT